MKLLFTHQCFGSLGGAEANAFITATEMKKRGHQVGLLSQLQSQQVHHLGPNYELFQLFHPQEYEEECTNNPESRNLVRQFL